MGVFAWGNHMIVQHYNAGQLLPEEIRTFLLESVQTYPSELGPVDLENWPIKLAKYSDCFCVRSSTTKMIAALFAYLNDTTFHQGFIPLICTLPYNEKRTGYLLHLSCLDVALKRGIESIGLEVLKTNTHAIAFYKRAGYQIVEDREDRNRWLMKLSITEG